VPGDANYDKVALLLHFDGSNGSTTFPDKSKNAATITAHGSVHISTADSKFGGASGAFTNATADYLSTAASAAYGIGTQDYTIEGWLKQAVQGSADRVLFDCRSVSNEGIAIYASVNATNQDDRLCAANNSAIIAGTSTTQWNAATNFQHWAVTRQGTTLRGFIDGALVWTVTDSRTYAAAPQCFIGANGSGIQTINGNLDEVRMTIGVARYTAAFTPPSAVFEDGMGQVSGVVKDASGANAARTVRAYRRDTGAKVAEVTSDGSTGAYSLYTPTLDEVNLIVLDNATSGTYYNDLIDRVIPA
jgi:hypothetical protein